MNSLREEQSSIIAALEMVADPKRAEGEKKYLKSSLRHIGVNVPTLRKAACQWSREKRKLTRQDLLAVVCGLWDREIHEARVVAAELLKIHQKLLEAEDLRLIEDLLRTSRTWALVDNLSTGVCASLFIRLPDAGWILDRWAADADFWLRRAALLSLLPSLRAGEGDFARFGRYADTMLVEREFFIRKAIGWVLRDTARKRPEMVAEWLKPRTGRASGLTLREAVKHMPVELKEALRAR